MRLSLLILTLFTNNCYCRFLPAFSGSSNLDKCHTGKCSRLHFNCECEKEDWKHRSPSCIPSSWMCDGWKDCDDGSDEQECSCPPDQFQCSWCEKGGACNGNIYDNFYQCISLAKYGNGRDEPYSNTFDVMFTDCFSRKDEREWYETRCRASSFDCNGYLTCSWLKQHDEICQSSKGCPSQRPIPCDCNKLGNFTCTGRGPTCYDPEWKCNGFVSCPDSSDELGCSCETNEFQCHCYVTNPVTCPKHQGCIPRYKANDGISDCPDDSDENRYRARGNCNQCQVTIKRFENKQQCQSTDNFDCNVTTCYEVASFHKNVTTTTDVLCSNATSCSDISNHEICARGFLCDDNGLTLATQFCDGRIDCLDESDEIRHGPGFKCVGPRGICVLPQINLYDDVAQCSDQSDLCFVMKNDVSCFQCLDKRLWISSKQVCDGTRDCFDYSDECLCEDHLYDDICIHLFPDCDARLQNNSKNSTSVGDANKLTIRCQTKYGETTATLCDGQPECQDFSDECNCSNRAHFCDDSCHSFYPIGDRYCDGYEDEAWKYINDSNCPKGFDERFCPNRFRCKAGNRVSISISQKCNGVNDCDDGADETNCLEIAESGIFSSNTEMIGSFLLRFVFWIMGFAVIGGNSFVIINTIRNLKQSKSRDLKYCFQLIVLNISIADFLMGVYLFIVAVYSASFSGIYSLVDLEWRSSLRCAFIGCLAIVSSETSCFLMVMMTSYRLYSVYYPFKSLQPPTRFRWNACIFMAWLFAVVLSIVPIIDQTAPYFADETWFQIKSLTTTHVWDKHQVALFACRLSHLTNTSMLMDGGSWNSVEKYLQTYFPQYAPKGEFGYYGETSVCLPRFFVSYGGHAWEYTLVVITVNLVSFLFIAGCYSLIIVKMKRQKSLLNKHSRSSKQEKTTQTRIARIILTDMACWVPICLMTYIKLGGGDVSDLAYIISAGLLLPINSAFNPLLLSSLPDKLFKTFLSLKQLVIGKMRQNTAEIISSESSSAEKKSSNEIATGSIAVTNLQHGDVIYCNSFQ